MNGIIILVLIAILLILGDETIAGAVTVMTGLCFVVYLFYNQKIYVDRCTIWGKTYYKKSNKVIALLRDFYMLPGDQQLLVVSLPDTEETVSIKTNLHHDCVARLEAAYQKAKQLNDPLPINVLVYDDGFGDKQYRIPDNWDSDLPYVNDVGVITIMKQKKTPDEVALIMHVLSEILIGIALVLLFSNEKAALVLLIIGISGMILFVPSSKIRLTKITKCGIIGASKTKDSNKQTASATETEPPPTQGMSDVSQEEADDAPSDGAKSKKTAAISAIQSITQKYEQGMGSQPSQTSALSKDTPKRAEWVADTVSATDPTSNANNEPSNQQKDLPMKDDQGDSRCDSEDSSHLPRTQKSGRKKTKGTSSKTSRSRKKKSNPKESAEGEQISFLSVMDESVSSDTDSTQPPEGNHPTSSEIEAKEFPHTHIDDSDKENQPPESAEPSFKDVDEDTDEPTDFDDLIGAEGGSFTDGPIDDDADNGDEAGQSDVSEDDAEAYGDLASLGVIDEEDDNGDAEAASLNEPTNEFDSTEDSEDQDTTPDGVEVISQENIEIVPTKKYRRNLYGDTLMKRRKDDTPQKIDFVIES